MQQYRAAWWIVCGWIGMMACADEEEGRSFDVDDAGQQTHDTADVSPSEPVMLDLIDSELWIPLSPDDPEDPFAPLRSPELPMDDCADLATRPELFGIEVDTGVCGFVTLAQPLPYAINPGEPLEVIAWHSVLQNDQEATGHVALAIDDVVVWEQRSRIPGPAQAWNETFTSPASFSKGATIYFHVRNHGANSWTLLTFGVEKREPQ